MKRKQIIVYQIAYFYRERFGTYSDYSDNQENSRGNIYLSKAALLADYPDMLSQKELLNKYNVDAIGELPDGSYRYYVETILFYY